MASRLSHPWFANFHIKVLSIEGQLSIESEHPQKMLHRPTPSNRPLFYFPRKASNRKKREMYKSKALPADSNDLNLSQINELLKTHKIKLNKTH